MRGKAMASASLPLATGLLALAGSVLAMPALAQQFSAAEIAAMRADYKRPPPRPVENQALVELVARFNQFERI